MDIMNDVLDDMESNWKKTLLNHLKPRCKNPIVWKKDV